MNEYEKGYQTGIEHFTWILNNPNYTPPTDWQKGFSDARKWVNENIHPEKK